MELWIRSQNKNKLCKAINLCIKTHTAYGNYGSYEQIAIYNDNIVLGDYTKERALEILDEIQKAILYTGLPSEELKHFQGEFIGDFSSNSTSHIAIYKMPKE